MADPNQSRKKRKITCTASLEGMKIAENALIRLGFNSKTDLATSQLLSRNTVTKFFQRQPIQLDSFKRICAALKLNWNVIAEITEKKIEELENFEQTETKCSMPGTDENTKKVQNLARQVTVIDKESKKIKAVIVLEGDINSIKNDLSITLEMFLKKFSGDTIKITEIKIY